MSRRYLLDTNAVADLIFHRRGVRERADEARHRGALLGTCPPVIAELFFGAENSQSREQNLAVIHLAIQKLKCWPFHFVEAECYGRLAAQLKRMGRPMQVTDIQLAAVAISLGDCTVVSSDSDLLAIPGLTVENWATALPN